MTKLITLTTLSILMLFTDIYANGTSNIDPAPSDKVVVYFVRPSGYGALINFTFFHTNKVIARFNGSKYVRYECEPGEHLFWARSENRDFVEANLETGKIYVIEAVPVSGAFKAGVQLRVVIPGVSRVKHIQKLLERKAPEPYNYNRAKLIQQELSEAIKRGLAKYDSMKEKNKRFKQLKADMSFTPQQLKFEKKERKKKSKKKEAEKL